jgi:hypothetical protein
MMETIWRLSKYGNLKLQTNLLKNISSTTNPGREIVTEDGHIQFSQVINLKITSTRGNWDPIFGVGGNLAFNWWYSGNGVRICLDGGYLSKADVNDDGTHGIGNEWGADAANGKGSTKWWHDVANVQEPCMGGSTKEKCEVQGTDHGSDILSSVKLGNYAIFVSSTIETFPWNKNCFECLK